MDSQTETFFHRSFAESLCHARLMWLFYAEQNQLFYQSITFDKMSNENMYENLFHFWVEN